MRIESSTDTATQTGLDPRVICSTITLRHLPLAEALQTIDELGFAEIDLGALPGVCDHVPYELSGDAVAEVTATVRASGLTVCSVNADVGDLNQPLDTAAGRDRREHVQQLLELCVGIGSSALVLPNGALSHEPVRDLDADLELVAEQLSDIADACAHAGVQLWTEAPHLFRLCHDLERSARLFELLPSSVGAVLDVSHIVAGGSDPRDFLAFARERLAHVHIRDAEPGYIHHSVGRGQVDFADLVRALDEVAYRGRLSLELETRDVENADRPAAALQAARFLSGLLPAS